VLWPIAGDGSSRRCASVKGRGCPRPHRRTFAAAILAFALSEASALLPSMAPLAAYAGSWGVGNPFKLLCPWFQLFPMRSGTSQSLS